ncbi:MAG: hypothetical protein K0R38_5250 [Polyangiaceae bacterium]|jgi:hypothetical protein|nr:hypothetical protein [Polyangiaceae bacterium]
MAGMGLTTLIACSSDRPEKVEDEQRLGTLSLPLRTVSSTGKVYFLRNAFFEIRNLNTGEVKFISTEEGLSDSSLLTTRLVANSQYFITLLDGWFLERFDNDGGGTGGSTSMGGSPGTAGKGSIPVGGTFIEEDPAEGGGGPASGGTFTAGEGPVEPPMAGKGGASSSGGTFVGGAGPVAGAGPIGGTGTGGGGPIGSGEIVPSERVRLVTEITPQTQFVFISPQSENFINFHFRVGDEVIEFNKGNLHISISVDDTPACIPPEGATRPERVLLDSNVTTTSVLTLRDALDALATNGGLVANAERLFDEIYDSFSSAPGQVATAKHCGDEITDGQPSLNGFPIDCDRAEIAQVGQIDGFRPTAFVNRLDLAAANGAHCGQQRIVFASQSFARSLMIVEAQVPNPHPELGLEGCRPLAEFWIAQNEIDDPLERGQRLRQAFLVGDVPGLEDFGPFFRAENLTVGSGQIRLNTFNSSPWTLRELKVARDGDTLSVIPFPVAESPNGRLWDENSGLPQGEACRENFLSAMDGLLTNDMSIMAFVVDGACKNSESRNDFFTEDYQAHLQSSPNFRSQLEQKLLSVGSKLSPDDIANRARFAGSCIGCHMEGRGQSLGDGVIAPGAQDFPMVLEFPTRCGDDATQDCFLPSNALTDVFLPGRMNVLAAAFGNVVPNPCTGGGGGGTGGTSGGFGGTFGTGGSIGTAGAPSMGGTSMVPPGKPEPAPVIEIELASADLPVEQLREEDAEIRQEYGAVTISGRSALSTH